MKTPWELLNNFSATELIICLLSFPYGTKLIKTI